MPCITEPRRLGVSSPLFDSPMFCSDPAKSSRTCNVKEGLSGVSANELRALVIPTVNCCSRSVLCDLKPTSSAGRSLE